VPIHSRLQGGVFSAPAGKKAPDAKHANAWLSSAMRELKIKLSVIDRFIFFLRVLPGCNEAQHSRWTFYEVVKLFY